jgi:DNA-binding NtrC family response regulator
MATVLLVDDEQPIRSALRKILEHSGLAVREANSGRAALEALDDDPSIAAVVSDFIMPELDGLDRGVPLINKLDDLSIVLDAVRLVLLRPIELP